MTRQAKVDGERTRKRSPRPLKTDIKRPGYGVFLREKWKDPEWRAMMMEKRAAAGRVRKEKRNFRQGVPDGMRKADAEVYWAYARRQAKRFIQIMEDAELVETVPIPGSEAEMAKAALEEAFVNAIGPRTDAKSKAAFIRIVLDFTKSKPESKSKLTLDKSEEWLDAVAADMGVNGRDSA
jgi:hypothetical protein